MWSILWWDYPPSKMEGPAPEQIEHTLQSFVAYYILLSTYLERVQQFQPRWVCLRFCSLEHRAPLLPFSSTLPKRCILEFVCAHGAVRRPRSSLQVFWRPEGPNQGRPSTDPGRATVQSPAGPRGGVGVFEPVVEVPGSASR